MRLSEFAFAITALRSNKFIDFRSLESSLRMSSGFLINSTAMAYSGKTKCVLQCFGDTYFFVLSISVH